MLRWLMQIKFDSCEYMTPKFCNSKVTFDDYFVASIVEYLELRLFNLVIQ